MLSPNNGEPDRFVDDAERRSRLITEMRDLRAAILELMDSASIPEADRESVIDSIENIERKLHGSDSTD